MKWKMLLPLVLTVGIHPVFGQAHEKGDILLSPGVSLGNYGFREHHKHHDDFGVGLIFYADFSPHDYASAGPYFGTFLSTGTAFGFGARGNFHWWQLTDDHASKDLKADILDLYFSLFAGAEVSSFYEDRARGGAILGLRWYFTEPVALMFEFGGPPMGFTTLGVTFKL